MQEALITMPSEWDKKSPPGGGDGIETIFEERRAEMLGAAMLYRG